MLGPFLKINCSFCSKPQKFELLDLKIDNTINKQIINNNILPNVDMFLYAPVIDLRVFDSFI